MKCYTINGDKMKKYEIIEQYIINEIESGNLAVGDQIMTEHQLSLKFDIGRLTINKALSILKQRGYIDRIAGKGSFVTSKRVVRSVRSKRSFTEDMKTIGLKAGSKLIEYRIIQAKEVPEIGQYLNLEPEDEIYFFTRLRTGDNLPIALAHTFLVAKIVGEFDIAALDGSLDDILEKKGIHVTSYQTKMSACMANDQQQKLLKVGKEALLKSLSFRFTNHDQIYEYTETYYISNRFEYSFDNSVCE